MYCIISFTSSLYIPVTYWAPILLLPGCLALLAHPKTNPNSLGPLPSAQV